MADRIRLKKVKIFKYKSFEIASEIDIDEEITTLVGVNESGKTAFLEAVAKTNYFENDDKFTFNTDFDYPRREKKRMERDGNNPIAISLTYQITEEIKKKISDEFDINEINELFTISVNYEGSKTINLKVMPEIQKFLKARDIPDIIREKMVKINDTEMLNKLMDKEEDEEIKAKIKKLLPYYDNKLKWDNPLQAYIYTTYIEDNIPKYMYFDEYYSLPSRVNLTELSTGLDNDSLKTAKALIELAGINIDSISQSSDYEKAKSELEATSADITRELKKYWKTNTNLRIQFDIDRQKVNGEIVPILEIRIENTRYMMTLPLKNRSKGFNWFFSFLVWFSKIQADKTNSHILLLDEPGLNLHAKAQDDLLLFLGDLSKNYQIIYTTHSPFMIDSSRLDRIRTLSETEDGSIISSDIQKKDPNTLFPLQAALGYNIAQNLFISTDNLLVEGPSDLIILSGMSEILKAQNFEGLSEKFTIVPVGGLDKVTTFISLMRANDLNIICLVDTFKDQKGKKKLKDLIQLQIINENKIRFFDSYNNNQQISEIEDVFTPIDYLKLYNLAFPDSQLKIDDLPNTDKDPIVQRIQTYLKNRFNHYKVAQQLIVNQLPEDFFSKTTINRFKKMIDDVNKIL
jgi:predicted ATP-dependent endonuclease of OLD family